MKNLLSILSFVLGFQLMAQQSTFNGLDVDLDSTGNYSFIVSGHFHGDGNNKSHLPVNTLMANMDWINDESGADFMICLGDLFLDIEADMPGYKEYFFNKLEMPLYNAVGNHDLKDNIYQDNFGATHYYFDLNMDRHIILDTEKEDGDITGDQLNLIQSALDASDAGELENVFIYSHRTVWKDHYEELDELFTENTQSITEPNFTNDVYPKLSKISGASSVYWFSGSMGGGPSSFFHHQDNTISYILSAIRGLNRDAVLLVNVEQGNVSFQTKSLTGQEVDALKTYDKEYWENTEEEAELSLGLMWYQFKVMLGHRYFWYGMSFAIIISLTVWFFRRRRKRA